MKPNPNLAVIGDLFTGESMNFQSWRYIVNTLHGYTGRCKQDSCPMCKLCVLTIVSHFLLNANEALKC